MSRHGGLEKKVIMADVEPGEKTGVYYMPICNLPFGTSWQDFKDWLRVDCDVDHVELFQSSTSGWIRLRGEENFNKAWTRLKKEYFRNRAIIASDKNRTESIKIKELVDSRVAQFGAPVRWELPANQAQSPDAILASSRSCIQEAVSLTSPLSPDHELGRLPTSISCPIGSVGVATTIAFGGITVLDPYMTMPEAYNALAASRNHALSYAPAFGFYEPPPPDTGTIPAAHYSGNAQYGGSSQPAVEPRYTLSHPSQTPIPYRSAPSTPIHAASAAASSYEPLAYTTEDACKVVVTSIQHKARPSDVSNWIRHQIGEYSSAITGLEIPLVEPKGRIRGHAFVTLANPTAAEATVRILDQKLFQGRVVSTRLTTDGILDAERSKPLKDSRPSRHHRPEHGKSSRHSSATEHGKWSRGGDDSKAAKASNKSSPSPPAPNTPQSEVQHPQEVNHGSGPVIAYGSSTRKADKSPCPYKDQML